MVVIEAVGQDLVLVLDKYGPLEQQLYNKLLNTGLKVGAVNVKNDALRPMQSKAVLLLDDVFESFVLSSLFNDTLNPHNVYAMGINRALLFKELRKMGYPTPEFDIALDPNVVAKVVRGIGRAYMATPAPSLGLDGVVITWEGSKSIAEHRMYMENSLARVNMLMKAPEKLFNAQVIGDRCVGCGSLESTLLRLSRDIGCVLCTYVIGTYNGEQMVLGLDPRVELTVENIDQFMNAIVGWLNGRW
ncbi:MAG: hypothetical protein AT716_01350 [Vulcanisaeta sp. MG_3]|nr:MAG: hypothetical protein AT716_01350 [Vulcanisaeta sp. MG_3]